MDNEHGNVLAKVRRDRKPLDPTEAQVEQLNHETALGPPERTQLNDGQLELDLERNGLPLVQIKQQ